MQEQIFIKNVNDVLKIDLNIPKYQRPYKWNTKNISDLLYDIEEAIRMKEQYGDNYKYRIGTIILHENNKYDIVDGQQRIISLILIKKCIDKTNCNLLNCSFSNKLTIKNIKDNYTFIKEWFENKNENIKQEFLKAFEETLEMVVITVDDVAEAFQLFDSQNARGKALEPHDLLKAYHLREMKDSPKEMEEAVKKWESYDSKEINILFNKYLFRIYNWSRGKKTRNFTTNYIDIYKGIEKTSEYTYAKKALKTSPYYQIAEPFVSGKDFFEMINYYLDMKKTVEEKIKQFDKINTIITDKKYKNSTGFGYAVELFKCSLMYYYDRFNNFDENVVIKLFKWALMIRTDMESVQLDTINKYAIGEESRNYTNNKPMFEIIRYARKHHEIANIPIKTERINNSAKSKRWQELYENLKKLNPIKDNNVN